MTFKVGDRVRITKWDEYRAWRKVNLSPSSDWELPMMRDQVATIGSITDDCASLDYPGYYMGCVPMSCLELAINEPDYNRLKSRPCWRCHQSSERIGLYMGFYEAYAKDGTIAVYHCPEHGNFEVFMWPEDEITLAYERAMK